MKFLGAILIFLSGTCIGLQQARELKKREERLLDLKRTIQWFRAEIRYTARPLSELISENEDSDFCLLAAEEPDFVRDPKEALQKAGEKLLKGSADLELYRGFVKGLGESDSQSQIEHMELYTELLEAHLRQAEEAREKKSSLYCCLGMFGGITLCLVLL